MRFYLFTLLLCIVPTVTRAEEPVHKAPSPSTGGLPPSKDTAILKGIVLFKGKAPDPKPIADIAGNAYCKEHHKDHLPNRDNIVIGKNADRPTLANVLVYVSAGLEGKDFDPPKSPVLLDQVGCMYTPHVVAVMAGQTLNVRNSDSTLHNVMSTPRENNAFNFGMPVKDEVRKITFKVPELKINVKCFMHPWMSGYVHVLDHPFFAVTGEDGAFTIQGLPPGKYTLTVLHEASVLQVANQNVELTLQPAEEKQVEFVYQMKGATR